MFKMLKAFSEISKITKLANDMAKQNPGTPRFGFLFTNRSFLVPAIGMLVNVLIILNFPLLTPIVAWMQSTGPELVTEQIVLAVTFITFLWSLLERIWLRFRGIDARVVVTRNDAKSAVTKVVGDDDLARALIRANL